LRALAEMAELAALAELAELAEMGELAPRCDSSGTVSGGDPAGVSS